MKSRSEQYFNLFHVIVMLNKPFFYLISTLKLSYRCYLMKMSKFKYQKGTHHIVYVYIQMIGIYISRISCEKMDAFKIILYCAN